MPTPPLVEDIQITNPKPQALKTQTLSRRDALAKLGLFTLVLSTPSISLVSEAKAGVDSGLYGPLVGDEFEAPKGKKSPPFRGPRNGSKGSKGSPGFNGGGMGGSISGPSAGGSPNDP